MRTKMFDKCIKNEMEEEMRKDLKEIRQDVTECKTDIAVIKQNMAHHRQEMDNINTRHIPPNILSKICCLLNLIKIRCWGSRGRNRMVVGFKTTYAISANHH